MTAQDPLEDLLESAFRRDFEASRPPAVTGRVMARIRARQRWRGVLLAVAGAAGVTAAAANLTPALEVLAISLPVPDAASPAVLLLALLGAASMLVLAEESL
jgi:hypothetical protein